MKQTSRRSLLKVVAAVWAAGCRQEPRDSASAGLESPLAGNELALKLLQMSDAQLAKLEEARQKGLAGVGASEPAYTGSLHRRQRPFRMAGVHDDRRHADRQPSPQPRPQEGSRARAGRHFELLGGRSFAGRRQDVVRPLRSTRLHEARRPQSRRLHPAVAPLQVQSQARPVSGLQAPSHRDGNDQRRGSRHHQRPWRFPVRRQRKDVEALL